MPLPPAGRDAAAARAEFSPVLVEAVTGAERELGTDLPVVSGFAPRDRQAFFQGRSTGSEAFTATMR